MKDENDRAEESAQLRRKAEEIARGMASQAPDHLSEAMHELQVHQIELEMQNEELRRTQAELEAERARYVDLYDLAPVGYCSLSEEGMILESNLAFAKLVGLPRSQLIRRPITRLIIKEDQDIFYLHCKRLFKTGEHCACELRMAKHDGSVFWVSLEASLVHNAEGAPICRLALSDVDERKQQEESHGLATRLILLINSDRDSRSCMSELTAALRDWSGCEAVGIRLRDEVGNPVLECMCGNGEGYESVALIPLQAGDQILGLLQFNDRRPERFTRNRIALFEELADSLALALSRRQAVQALKERESNLRQLFENMEEGFGLHEVITDRDGSVIDFRVVEANRAYERHTGQKPADIIGRTMLEVLPNADPRMIEKFGRVALTGEALSYDYFSAAFDRYFHIRIFRASPRRFAAVFEDITERKRKEEELRVKSQLLENIFATSADFIFVKDRQLRTIMCNEAFSRLLGKRPEDLVGKTDIENGWDPEHVKGNSEKGIVGYEQSDLETLEGRMVRTVYDRSTELGTVRVVDSIKQPLRNSAGEIVGLLGISRDISDQVKTRIALENRERELEDLTRELRDLNEYLIEVREEERRRFAQEIHDDLGQRLTALNLGLYAIMGDLGIGRDDLRSRLDGLVGLTKESMAAIQSLASRMRPRILDDLGLESALEWLVANQGAQGGPLISLEQDLDESRLSPELGIVIFRLVQESLTNILRHAQAGHAMVSIRMNEHKLFLKVEDDGVGITTEQRSDPHSFGILGMRERALSLDGSFSISGAEGCGTVVAVELPLGKRAEAENG